MTTSDSEHKTNERYWIAINGASCALCRLPSTVPPTVTPRPQGLIGFRTLKEAQAAQSLCLTAPIPEVAKAIKQWRRGKSGVVCVDVPNPEPPTTGPTIWSLPGKEEK